MIGLLIIIVVILIVLSLAVYAIQYYAPFPPPIKNLVILLCFLIAILLILAQIGVLGPGMYLYRPAP